jgi:hypothetical protein
MNYISKLQQQVSEDKATMADAAAQLRDVIAYLSSSKFRCGDELDGYVNINDLLPRLQQAVLTITQE